ncbi:MAG: FAD-dependent oxidoreductase [Lagierella massiliensis]|nr:FAD-dependent oxidoreductase [Lagierella massiliensis]
MKTVILAGAGHGHIQILSKLKSMNLNNLNIIVITNYSRQFYSGMLPGYICGKYSIDDISFDVSKYCNNPNISLYYDEIVEVNRYENYIRTMSNKFYYDFLSLNLGSKSIESFGPERKSLQYVKPIKNFSSLKDLEHIKRLLIVGGGASGVELALSYRCKYKNLDITIVHSGNEILPRFNHRTRFICSKLLFDKNIKLILNKKIQKIEGKTAYFKDNKIDFDLAIVSTGVTGVDIKFTGFEVDEKNFLKVDNKLFACENVLAMGDMVHLKNFPNLPKVGVFAIKMTPILLNNLFYEIFNIGELKHYIPQRYYLQILNTGDGNAILSYGFFAIYSRWAFKLKDFIDKNYMKGNLINQNPLKNKIRLNFYKNKL